MITRKGTILFLIPIWSNSILIYQSNNVSSKMGSSEESKKLMPDVVIYFKNYLGSQFRTIQKTSAALKVP